MGTLARKGLNEWMNKTKGFILKWSLISYMISVRFREIS